MTSIIPAPPNAIRRLAVGVGFAAISMASLQAADTGNDAAPVTAWDAIAQRAEASKAAGKKGYDHNVVALDRRDKMKSFYADYAGWTPPAPLPVKPGFLRNLPDKPAKPRFPLTGKVWPASPGEASVCLWEDDKVAAASVSVDDNCATDLPNWRKISADYGGLAVTWNLITKNITDSAAGKPDAQAGDWKTWQQMVSEGFRVESHSVTHVADPVREDGWPGPEWEALVSKQTIEQNIPGYQVRLFAYPGSAIKEFGMSYNWKDNLPAYYLAARGFSGVPISPANQIDYFDIRTTASPEAFIEPPANAPDWIKRGQYSRILNPDPANPLYRGWATVFTHFLGKGAEDLANSPSANHRTLAKVFKFFNDNRRDIWIGALSDIARYGQERDTATLKTLSASASGISLELTSQMDPAYYDYPLTLKVRLPDGWKTCSAKQSGKSCPVTLLDHEGGRFALVKALPNKGTLVLAP